MNEAKRTSYKRMGKIKNMQGLLMYLAGSDVKVRPAKTGEPDIYALVGTQADKRLMDKAIKKFAVD